MVGESRNWTLALLVCGLAFVVSGIAALGIDATNPISREETEQEGVGQ